MQGKTFDNIFKKLQKAGLRPYIHAKAKSGSKYIKFKSFVNGSLRIADHSQRSRYAYRWNLRSDINEYITKFKGHDCYYYPIEMVDDLIKHLQCTAGII